MVGNSTKRGFTPKSLFYVRVYGSIVPRHTRGHANGLCLARLEHYVLVTGGGEAPHRIAEQPGDGA